MANNRNVIGMPYPAPNGSLKTLVTNSPNIYSPKNRTIVKKTYVKRKVLNLAMVNPKVKSASSQSEPKSKSSKNNNSTNAKNRNQAKSPVKLEIAQTSQIKADFGATDKESSHEKTQEAKIKDEDATSVGNDWTSCNLQVQPDFSSDYYPNSFKRSPSDQPAAPAVKVYHQVPYILKQFLNLIEI